MAQIQFATQWILMSDSEYQLAALRKVIIIITANLILRNTAGRNVLSRKHQDHRGTTADIENNLLPSLTVLRPPSGYCQNCRSPSLSIPWYCLPICSNQCRINHGADGACARGPPSRIFLQRQLVVGCTAPHVTCLSLLRKALPKSEVVGEGRCAVSS